MMMRTCLLAFVVIMPGVLKADDNNLPATTRSKIEKEIEDLKLHISDFGSGLSVLNQQCGQLSCKLDNAKRKLTTYRKIIDRPENADCRSFDLDGESYTRAQLESQIRLLLAEKKGFEVTLEQLGCKIKRAEAERANAVVMLSYLETQLPVLDVNQMMFAFADRQWESLKLLNDLELELQAKYEQATPHPFEMVQGINTCSPARWIVSDQEYDDFLKLGDDHCDKSKVAPQAKAKQPLKVKTVSRAKAFLSEK